jgi:CHAT domain-containing protein
MAPGFDIVHFAGHAVVDPTSPALSALIFAVDRDSGEPASLYADRISALAFGKVRVVVLAACSTAEGQILGTEGVLSLARAFLAAGVPTVVASLGPVGDAQTAEILDLLHQELRTGSDAAAALRRAQLIVARSRSAGGRAAWAAFEIFGGV